MSGWLPKAILFRDTVREYMSRTRISLAEHAPDQNSSLSCELSKSCFSKVALLRQGDFDFYETNVRANNVGMYPVAIRTI